MELLHRVARMAPERPGITSSFSRASSEGDQEAKYDDKSGWSYPPSEGDDGAPAQLVARKEAPNYLKRPFVFTGYLIGAWLSFATPLPDTL
jgi:hypothetical protein